MAERKATFVEAQIHEKGIAKADQVNLEFAPTLGMSLPEFAIQAWDVDDEETLDTRQSRSFSFFQGFMTRDVAVLPAHVGPFGEPGDITDTTSNELLYEHDGELANRNLVRACVFTVAPDRGLLMIEHARAGSLRSKVETKLRRLVAAKGIEATFTFTSLVRGQSWLEAKAELEALTILRPTTTGDLADGLQLKEAQLELKIQPAKGTRAWPKLWPLLSDKGILPDDFLRVVEGGDDLGEVEDSDQVYVTVGDGTQSKTFLLGDEKTPSLREVIPTRSPTGIPTDEELVRWGSEAAQKFGDEDRAK